MTVSDNKVVSVSYTLHQDNAAGEVVEQTQAESPFTFLFGAGNLLPEFEANLKGKGEGDAFAFGIAAENAYGSVRPDLVVDLPKSSFVVDGELVEELLEVGKVIPMQDHNGNPLNGKVVEVGESSVKLDFNNPMAGIDLYFTGKVEALRNATESEIEHGHVHGPGGHHHHH